MAGEFIQQLHQAGFSDEEVTDFATRKRASMTTEGRPPSEIDDYLGTAPAPESIPRPFLDRLVHGTDIFTSALVKSAQMGSHLVSDPESQKLMSDTWVGHLVQDFWRGLTIPRDIAEGKFNQTGTLGTEEQIEQERWRTEEVNRGAAGIANVVMPGSLLTKEAILAAARSRAASTSTSWMGQFWDRALGVDRSGMVVSGIPDASGNVTRRALGPVPNMQMFEDGAKALTDNADTARVSARLQMLFEQHGLHPAEVVAEAQRDPVVAQTLLAHGFDVWHGTPHDFEAFDLGKINTGEGAQVFGWGLYFAEKHAISKFYADNVRAAVTDDFEGRLREAFGATGNMYRVRLMAEREAFFDRDIPFSEQPLEIKEKFEKALSVIKNNPKFKQIVGLVKDWPGLTGAWFDTISRHVGPKEWALALRDAGIPGLKYRDASSRGDIRDPTRNFVVFDDKIVRIAEKNDAAVIPGSARSGELHSLVAQTGRAGVDRIITDPEVRAAIDNPRIDRSGNVPLGAHASADLNNNIVHVDKSIPTEVTISGRTFDPAIPLTIRELVERKAMEERLAAGDSPVEAYKEAHDNYAMPAMKAWLEGHGIDVKEFGNLEGQWLKGTAVDDFGQAVQGLYPKPYRETSAGLIHGHDAHELGDAYKYFENQVTGRGETLKETYQRQLDQVEREYNSLKQEHDTALAEGRPPGTLVDELEKLSDQRIDLQGKLNDLATAERPKPGSVEEAQQNILNRVSVGEKTRVRGLSWSRLYTYVVDKLFPIQQLFSKMQNGELLTSQDGWKLSRLYAGWTGKAEHFLKYGTFDYKTYEVNGKSLDEVLAPVKDDLDGFRAFVTAARAAELDLRGIDHGFNMEDVRAVGKAGKAKYASVFKELVDYQNRVSAYLRDSGVISDKAYQQMLKDNLLYVPFNRMVADVIGVRQPGNSLQAVNPIKKLYGSERVIVDPLENVIKNTYLLMSMAEKNTVTRTIVDFLTEERAGANRLRSEAEKVAEARDISIDDALKEALKASGVEHPEHYMDLLDDVVRPAKDTDGYIRVFNNGRRQTFRVDEDLARAVKGLDAESIGLVEKLMAPLAGTLRAGAVLDPAFAARHTFRDYIYSFITNQRGVFTPVDMMRGFAGLVSRDADYLAWLQGGGGNVTMVSMDRRWLQESLRQLTGETGLFTRAWNVVVDPQASYLKKGGAVVGLPFATVGKFVVHPLRMLSELAMSASHLGAFKKAMRIGEGKYLSDKLPEAFQRGEMSIRPGVSTEDAVKAISDALGEKEFARKEAILDAAWASRDTGVDMGRIGAKMRSANMVSAFLRAKILDTATIGEALVKRPLSTSLKIGIGVTLPSLVNWWVNKDDSRYQNLPDWEKAAFWVVPTDKWEDAKPGEEEGRPADQVRFRGGKVMVNNGIIWRVPKPFATGVLFGSGPEFLADAWYRDHPHAFKHWAQALGEQTIGDLTPNAVAPMIDQFANTTTWPAPHTLIPGQLEKRLPEYQYTPYTTETSKALGKFVASMPGFRAVATDDESVWIGGSARALTSPILMEHYVDAWAGSLGRNALALVDAGLRKAGIVANPEKPEAKWWEGPFIRSFTVRYPTATAQPIQDFFTDYKANQRFFDTWQAKAREGDADALEWIEKAGGPQIFVQLKGYHDALTTLSSAIRGVTMNPEIPAPEKRQLVDGMYYGMVEVGLAGRQALKQAQEALSDVR